MLSASLSGLHEMAAGSATPGSGSTKNSGLSFGFAFEGSIDNGIPS